MGVATTMELRKIAFLHILGHVEDYPIDRLVLLPITVRKELLLNLSARDVQKLEGTAFTSGTDMEYVWKTLYYAHGYGLQDLYVRRKSSFMCISPSYKVPEELKGRGLALKESTFSNKKLHDSYINFPYIPGGLHPPPQKLQLTWKECYMNRIFEMLLNYYYMLDDSCKLPEHLLIGGLYGIVSPYLLSEDRSKVSRSFASFGLNTLCSSLSCVRYIPDRYWQHFNNGTNSSTHLMQTVMHHIASEFHFKPFYVHVDCNELQIRTSEKRLLELKELSPQTLKDFFSEVNTLYFTCSLSVLSSSDREKLSSVYSTIDISLKHLSQPLNVVRHQPFASPPVSFFRLVWPNLEQGNCREFTEISLSFDDSQSEIILFLLRSSLKILKFVNLHSEGSTVSSSILDVLAELFSCPHFKGMFLTGFSFQPNGFLKLLLAFYSASTAVSLSFGGCFVSSVVSEPVGFTLPLHSIELHPEKCLKIFSCAINSDIMSQVILSNQQIRLTSVEIRCSFNSLSGEHALFSSPCFSIDSLNLLIMSYQIHTKWLPSIFSNAEIRSIRLAVIGFWGTHPAAKSHVSELADLFSSSCGSLRKIVFVSDILDCNEKH